MTVAARRAIPSRAAARNLLSPPGGVVDWTPCPDSVDGDKLTVKMKAPDGKDNSETNTTINLRDKALHIKDSKGKTDEFRRKQTRK